MKQRKIVIYYNLDDNNFSTEYGEILYNLWTIFWPEQIYTFLKNKTPSKVLRTKGGYYIEIVII